MTAGPSERVAAMLTLLRPVADEIVVALDDRTGDEDARTLAGVADVVVPFPYAEPVDRSLPWLFRHCSGDWVLLVDDDEIPSRRLIYALPSLVAADDVTHYWLRRKWLYPDALHWLDDHPWRTDYQLRLVLRDHRLVRFPDETHIPIEALGPCRYIDAPLYHADCLLRSAPERLAKAQRYERLRPGQRIAGGPMNHVFHLPERRPVLSQAAVPEEDVVLIDETLSAAPVRRAPRGRLAQPATREEIDRFWSGRLPRESDYRARLELVDPVEEMFAAEQRTIAVRVENLGGQLWPWGGADIQLATRWLDPDGSVVREGLWSPFPADLPPSQADIVPVNVVAPGRPGLYRLLLDLIHDRVRWFGCELSVEVAVRPSCRVGVAGDDRSVERALTELTEERPHVEPVVIERPGPGPPRFGAPRVTDLHAYLFEGAPTVRPLWAPTLLARTARLFRAARRLRRGREIGPLPRGARELLAGLAQCGLLLVVGTAEADTCALWERAALVHTARTLGVEVELAEGALPRAQGPLDRILLRIIR